ncbi:unnamed protein product [Camellia sinensis]
MHNSTTSLLDLLLSSLRDKLGLNNNRLRSRQKALAEDLKVAELRNIDDRSVVGGSLVLDFVGDEGPELVDVDDGAMELVAEPVEVPHADLAEVTWMVLVEQDSVVVHTSGVSSASGMLAVFSDSPMASADVASLLPVLLQPRRH